MFYFWLGAEAEEFDYLQSYMNERLYGPPFAV